MPCRKPSPSQAFTAGNNTTPAVLLLFLKSRVREEAFFFSSRSYILKMATSYILPTGKKTVQSKAWRLDEKPR
jgi:hypothetical protein